MNRKIAVVIPAYKEDFDKYEKVSFERCYEVFSSHYDVILFTPETTDFTQIRKNYPLIKHQKYNTEAFASIASYNKMLLSADFYCQFSDYQYILIYQLDGYVFRDRLAEWCDMGYDYVGAPWLFRGTGVDWINLAIRNLLLLIGFYHISLFRYRKVGNGGVSLRNVQRFAELAESISGRVSRSERFRAGRFNEDIYWSLIAKGLSKPDWRTAARFSIDMLPSGLNDVDPDLCHGWSKNIATRNYWQLSSVDNQDNP